jgi:hypothetical protein
MTSERCIRCEVAKNLSEMDNYGHCKTCYHKLSNNDIRRFRDTFMSHGGQELFGLKYSDVPASKLTVTIPKNKEGIIKMLEEVMKKAEIGIELEEKFNSKHKEGSEEHKEYTANVQQMRIYYSVASAEKSARK